MYRSGSIDSSFLSRDAFSMSMSAFINWVKRLDILTQKYTGDNKKASVCMALSVLEVDEMFRQVNVDEDSQAANGDSSLERYEFVEIFVRLALATFYQSPGGDWGSCTSPATAFVAFMERVVIKTTWLEGEWRSFQETDQFIKTTDLSLASGHEQRQKWRSDRMYQKPIFDLLAQYQTKLLTLFKEYAQEPFAGTSMSDMLGHHSELITVSSELKVC